MELAGGHLFKVPGAKALQSAAEEWRSHCPTLTEVIFRDRADSGRHHWGAHVRVFTFDQNAGQMARNAPEDGKCQEKAQLQGRSEYERWADKMIVSLRR
jgi:hypothetical protein